MARRQRRHPRRGQETVAAYRGRTFAELSPNLETLGIKVMPDGRVSVLVHQTARDHHGNVVGEGRVRHLYQLRDGLIERMDVEAVEEGQPCLRMKCGALMIRTLTFLVLATLLFGCMGSTAQVHYAVSGFRSEPLPGMQGEVFAADGEPSGAMGQSLGASPRRLLTFLFLTPGAGGNGSQGGSANSGGPVASFVLTNGLPPNRVEAKVEWDKRPDVVTIDGTKYDRANGNLFVIVKSPGSTAEVWQLKPPSKSIKAEDMLAHAKKELPTIKAVQSASFE